MPNVIIPNVISSEYFMSLALHSAYVISYYVMQIVETVIIFFLHFSLPNPSIGIETYTLLAWNNIY